MLTEHLKLINFTKSDATWTEKEFPKPYKCKIKSWFKRNIALTILKTWKETLTRV